jgi:hypothetical protein
MNDLRTVAAAAALAVIFMFSNTGSAVAQEQTATEASEEISLQRLAARIEERAEVLATRVEERGERLAARAAERGREQLAARIEENAEQDADNIRRTGNYLATCVNLDVEEQDCEPHGYAELLVPDDTDPAVFGEAAEDGEATAE